MPADLSFLRSISEPPVAKPPPAALFGRGPIACANPIHDARPRYGKAPVPDSEELQRILRLPRRELNFAEPPASRFNYLKKSGPCQCAASGRPCPTELFSVQAVALAEIADRGGLLGPIGAGHGKTLLDLLTPMVCGSQRAVLLLPRQLKSQLLDSDWPYYGAHWQLPNLGGGRWFTPGLPVLFVVAFSELSGEKNTDLLESLHPDTLIIDETHNLANPSASRTMRVERYLNAHPTVKAFAWSGSLTKRSIRDYGHLSAWALRAGSPLPRDDKEIESWAQAIDPDPYGMPAPMGALRQLCTDGEHIRDGFARRLVETPGVVVSDEAPVSIPLVINERKLETPLEIRDLISQVDRENRTPDEEELVTPADKAKCVRELAAGFFYRWIWPRQEPQEIRMRWLLARKLWSQEVRYKLESPRVHLDSPLLLAKAAIRWCRGGCVECHRAAKKPHRSGCSRAEVAPVWHSETWPEWELRKGTARPETEAVWVSDFLVEDSLAWAKQNIGIVWSSFDALTSKLAGALPCFGGGPEASATIYLERGDRSIAASIKAHGTGKNLQRFSRCLVASPPSDGRSWEQLLARTHRPGQQAPEVLWEVYRHTVGYRDAIEQAQSDATYAQETLKLKQRLKGATYGW